MHTENLNLHLEAHRRWLTSKGAEGERLILQGVNLSQVNLRGAQLERASITGSDFFNTDLSHANLRGASLHRCDFRKTILRGAQLSGASLRGALFSLTDLSYTDMRGADLFSTDLRGACLRSARLPEGTWLISGEIYDIQITNGSLLRVGCEEHPVWDWRSLNREEVLSMDGERALKFYPRLLTLLDCHLGQGERPEWLMRTL
ncbi:MULTISPECIES: pentapeptide repeat-containing protein [unclassified Pantoea]|uniref:pentapeptide repeat-containing protein n=1 Tax=unclassified Pantoea TaxID=2630326 RepID=UPI00301E109A